MNNKLIIFILSLIPLFFIGCEKNWNDHYNTFPETVDANVWDDLQNDSRVSSFIGLLKEYNFDTLFFNSDIAYTLFIPKNEVLNEYLNMKNIDYNYLGFHIASHFIQSGNIQGRRVVQTITEKYIEIERYGNNVSVNGKNVSFESPLYNNGKYYIIDEIIEPQMNLYEYFKISNPVLSEYIDSRDSIALDRALSKPIGFDENGNTVYDSISEIINLFEIKYFPVKHEFRENSATIVFPKSEDYIEALNEVADNLGSDIQDYQDIPIKWQHEVLMPFLFKKGIFLNRIEPEEFIWKSERDTAKLLNILGDSVVIDYTPIEKFVGSNGYAYNYLNFEIPDSLYKGKSRKEAESLLMETGINRFRWRDDVIVQSALAVQPQRIYVASASNDSLLRVELPKGYNNLYSFQFKGPNLFPGRYVMVAEVHMDFGGVFDIYINGELARTFDYYDFFRMNGIVNSVRGNRFIPRGRYNRFDMFVENITSYDEVDIKFEYKGPSLIVPNNGIVIDYIEFEPVNN